MKFHHLALILLSTPAFGQSLNNLNLDYWYDPNAELELIINPINTGKQVRVYYQITSTRKENTIGSYSIAWENRQSLTEKSGEAISATDSVIDKTINSISGMLTFPGSTKRWYLTAKVTNNSTQGFFYFYKPIDPLWPVNNVVTVNRNALMKRYVALGSEVSGSKPIGKNVQGFMYKKIFDAAQPSFAELGRTDPFLKADSVFVLPNTFIPKSIGLYLFQEDTTSAMGISFLATERSYPKFTSLASLAGPLIYITTDEEYQRLGAALTDKAAFDKVILEITRDKERAKNLMRSYFQRVEAANRYFTEYKEGWKTDRGMIYIIYGKPDEVSRTASDEIWFYRNQKTKFEFNKTGSVFCPENYKLQRDKKYMQEWFSLVDLWRKSRF